jgi:D-apiose dehydrogenase
MTETADQQYPKTAGARRRFDIALVGCGGVAQMHLEGYAAHPERVRVVAACDVDLDRAKAAACRWGIPHAFPSLQGMIEAAEWEVAVVCTPTPVREAVVQALAASGKHLLVEKPLADSLQKAQRMVTACRSADVLLAVDQNFRHHYPFEQARGLIAAGRLGIVRGIAHQDLFFRQDVGWRTQCPRHALSVMGIHWLDGFRWLLGSEARSVACQTHASAAILCAGETDAHVQITFQNGAIVTYVQSFSSPLPRTETRVVGDEGLLVLHYRGAALYERDTGREPVERWPNPYAGANKPESAFVSLNHLLTAIESGQEPPNSGRDNLRTVALLEAAYRSASEQRVVDLSDEDAE